MSDDRELLTAWRDGDTRAGERLFDRHFRAIARFFRNKVPHDRAEDLIQATFLGGVEGLPRFREDTDFRAYLFGVAANVLRNHFRRQHGGGPNVDFTATTVHDLAPRPSQVLAERREHRLLLEALRRIPLEHQILVELFYWERLSAARIAAALELPEGTVRTRLRRARQLLAEAIAGLAGDGVTYGDADLDAWADDVRRLVDCGV